MKKLFLFGLMVLGICMSAPKSNPTTYLYSNARMKYRNVEGINVKMNERLTLVLWRADWYRHTPINQNGVAEWWGYDFSPGLTYKLYSQGPWSIVGGLNELIILRLSTYREHRERANLNFSANFGLLSLGTNITGEHRQYNTDLKFEKYRARILFKASTSKGFTSFQLTPFITWETFYQKRDALDNLLQDSFQYREAEVGITGKLSPNVSVGMADMFEYNPTRTNYRGEFSAHRFGVNFNYNVDLSKK